MLALEDSGPSAKGNAVGSHSFAPGHDADISGSVQYELVTAFEVFEHIPEPSKTVAHLLSISDSILFSTEPLPIPAPPMADWWYYGPEHGQHIAFFTRVALQQLASRFDANYYTNGGSIHLISRRHISEKVFRLVLHPKGTRVGQPFLSPQVFIGRRFRCRYATSQGSD